MSRVLVGVVAVALVVLGLGCTSASQVTDPATPEARLTSPDEADVPAIAVVGLPPELLSTVRAATLTADEWSRWLRVSVATDGQDVWSLPAVLGDYVVSDEGVRFTPRFGLDPGRAYRVVVDVTRLPDRLREQGGHGEGVALDTTVRHPAAPGVSTTTVVTVYPTSDSVPENLLRLYIEFSAPMSTQDGVEHVRLLGPDGQVVEDPFLPLDLALWNEDRTRFTLLFDPGRVKRGILPHRELGPALVDGQTYTLVVDRQWRDAEGMSLARGLTRQLTAGSADHRAIDPDAWRIEAPAVGTRQPLRIRFARSLDHALLQRALRVVTDGDTVRGETEIGEAETAWRFVPDAPWIAEAHELVVLPTLEDPAGNRIGRPFETATADRTAPPDDRAGARIPFRPTS